MHYEIERKLLVRDDKCNGSASLRVRIIDRARATLTLKVADIRHLEFEYSIPLTDGAVLLLREGGLIEKLRYRLPWCGLVWEVHVFQGENLGLVIAEIELPHEDKVFQKPDWLGKEVTSDQRYSNATLTQLPFQKWPDTSEQEHLTCRRIEA